VRCIASPGRGTYLHRRISLRAFVLLPAILLCLAGTAFAGQETVLHDAATLSGTVTDADGDAIVGASVKLHLRDSNIDTVTDTDGHFQFSGVAPQHAELSVKAEGFATATSSVVLQANQALQLDPIKLGAAAHVNVEVGALTQEELSEQQVHLEEHQRLGGIVPNFFVSYSWQAPPLSIKQKFELAWRTSIDPVNLLLIGGTAGVQQAQDHFKLYGEGAQGYAKRFGANYADLAIGTFIGGAILPSLFHQDPRYFYLGKGSFWKRAGYALSTAVICRGDNGRWQPSYSGILGDIASGAASNLYYPSNDRTGLSVTLQNGLMSVAFDGMGNLLQEFIFHKITPGIPKTKPPVTPSIP
jgi:hypothetical protein